MVENRVTTPTRAHALAIAQTMREADALECRRAGVAPADGVMMSLDASIYSRCLLIDDVPMAIWGLGGNMIDDAGRPWLFTARGMEKKTRLFLAIGPHEIDVMLGYYPLLWNAVDAEYAGALRLVKKLGFKVGPAEPMFTGALFRRIERTS